jgi:hypothetical protein
VPKLFLMTPDLVVKILAGGALLLGVIAVIASMTSDSSPSPSDPGFNAEPAALAEVATESEVTVPDDVPPGVYPPAESTAVGMTPEWRKFADAVDRICALSYNYTLAREARLEQRAKQEGWGDPKWEVERLRLWSTQGTLILQATAKLGPPPAEADLFKRWRANVAMRRAVRNAAADAGEGGGNPRFYALLDRLTRLKDQSDVIGQRFGLRICTSN